MQQYYLVDYNKPIFNHLCISNDDVTPKMGKSVITAQHYVKVHSLILTDFGSNIRRYETLTHSTKLVLWMSRKQQNKSDQLEKLLRVCIIARGHLFYPCKIGRAPYGVRRISLNAWHRPMSSYTDASRRPYDM